MKFFSFLTIFLFTLFVLLGFFVYQSDKKSAVHRLFLAFALSLAYWDFCLFQFSFTTEVKTAQFWTYLAMVGPSLTFTCMLFFFIRLTHLVKLNIIAAVVLLIFPVIFIYRALTAPLLYTDFNFINGVWKFRVIKEDPWTIVFILWEIICHIASIALLTIWRIKTTSNKEKKQSVIIITSLLIIPILASINIFFFPFIGIHFEGYELITHMFYIIGTAYAIIKYKFLALSPEHINKEIYDNIDDSIILLDPSFRIISVNTSTETETGRNTADLKGRDMAVLFREKNKLKSILKEMIAGNHNSFCAHVKINGTQDHPITLDAKISQVNDKFGDYIGILVIGHPVKQLQDIKIFFNITNREYEIIQNIIDGKTNNDIAQELCISTRTVKTHITNIYNKLRVNNRMELLNLLKEFNIVPQRTAEKTVLFQ